MSAGPLDLRWSDEFQQTLSQAVGYAAWASARDTSHKYLVYGAVEKAMTEGVRDTAIVLNAFETGVFWTPKSVEEVAGPRWPAFERRRRRLQFF